MDPIKTHFSIKDLENLSGIKAHTIRIWEKRYNLLDPNRTASNIRTYDLDGLCKLLNITYLIEKDHKISKVARLSSIEIQQLITDLVASENLPNHQLAINAFKVAMMNFDNALFKKTYADLAKFLSLPEIFTLIFIPLLEEIGLLWQAGTIDPAHEHFISSLIKLKILVGIEKEENTITSPKDTYVLFLPENEFHDLGLVFIHYTLAQKGHQVIYLGQSIQLQNLKFIAKRNPQVKFLSYLTVKPDDISILDYTQQFNTILNTEQAELILLGRKINDLDNLKLPNNIATYNTIESFSHSL